MFYFFLRLPVRWDDRCEKWFKTFCILISSQTLASEQKFKTSVSVKDKVTHCACITEYRVI